MMKLNRLLYHGTSATSAVLIIGVSGFRTPIHLTESRDAAVHYGKAAEAYVERLAKEENGKLLKEGYAVFTFTHIPDMTALVVDDYNLTAEPGQWKYLKPIRDMHYLHVEYFPLEVDEYERLALQCFAIGMWRK